MTVLTFTPREAAILLDRLTVPECIATALTDVAEGEEPYPYAASDIELVVTAMRSELELLGTISLSSDQLDRDVLHDVVDGSVYASFIEDAYNDQDWTMAELKAAKKAMAGIEKKLAKIGINASFT